MPRNSNTENLVFITESTEQLRSNLDAIIQTGDEAEVDTASKLYEEELEKVFSFKAKTHNCVSTKLNFTKTVLITDHPIPDLVERAFESLSEDLEHLFVS